MPKVNRPIPTVYLGQTGCLNSGGLTAKDRYPFHVDAPPQVRLAHVPGAQGDNVLTGRHGVARMESKDVPALLISYYYLEKFLEFQHKYFYRNWAMDSGAFSAFAKGIVIDLQEYIDKCKQLMETDPTLTEIFALDVIGDWKASLKNTEEMWRQGVPAIPCFHYGEPWDVLKGLARDYPKIAFGGMVGQAAGPRDKWIGQCFARVWPKSVHGFGLSGEKTVMAFPFSSVDATNWELGPCRYGRWNAFKGKLSVRGSKQNLRCEVLWYLDLEDRARERWKAEMELLKSLEPAPQVRLSVTDGQGRGSKSETKYEQALSDPTIRLSVTNDGMPSKDKYIEALKRPTPKVAPPTIHLGLSGDHVGDGSSTDLRQREALRPDEERRK